MKISKNFLLFGMLILSAVSVFLSCKGDDDEDVLIGNWLERSDYESDARSQAVAFTIGNNAYVGSGYNYDNDERLKDFWQYHPETDNWTQIAALDFGVNAVSRAKARSGAVAFSASGKGYVGLGKDEIGMLGDFWVYNPVENEWDTLDAVNVGPNARYGAVAFTINNIGYVGTGNDGSNLKDLWAYDPNTNSWTQKTSFQSKVSEAVSFVLDGKGYICTGYHNEYNKDFYMYDPQTNLWTEKRKIADVSDDDYDDTYTIIRRRAVAFVVGSKAYVASGDVNNSFKNDVWEYDPQEDLWTARTGFEGTPRNEAVAFTLEDGRGFITTGASSTIDFDDLWEFHPTEDYNEDD